ncbi:MAG: ABC transporter substrate-binding protein [Alphaproteobacteria bacterium]
MPVRRLLIMVIVAALLGVTGSARATVNDAALFINQLGNQAITALRATDLTLSQREAKFRSLLSQGFDLRFIGRFVLGRYWRRATPEQQNDYIALYGEFLLQTYASRLGGYSGETMTVTGARQASEKEIVVSTTLDRPGGLDINADWRVRVIEGRYRIIDVAVEGISMAFTQRSDFAAVIKRDGIEGLLTILRARTTKISATASIN